MQRCRPPYPDVLTPREWEVLSLLREGFTNKQIAARLGISERGAKYHVSEILSKLGVDGRVEASTWRGQPLRRVPLLAVILARFSGTLARVGFGLLASALLALFVLALGVGVMERRSGPTDWASREAVAEQTRQEKPLEADAVATIQTFGASSWLESPRPTSPSPDSDQSAARGCVFDARTIALDADKAAIAQGHSGGSKVEYVGNCRLFMEVRASPVSTLSDVDARCQFIVTVVPGSNFSSELRRAGNCDGLGLFSSVGPFPPAAGQ
jgi:DNA-binding CsgD family transcriptional regulator